MKIGFQKKYLFIGVGTVVILLGLFFALKGKQIEISNQVSKTPSLKTKTENPLTGMTCEDGASRPFAIMVSSDAEARPLSGIGEADMVFEMPVVDNGFTRMMAVYQCNRPKEVGSIRSSRLDFVPLALGLNAIYAHFGGERAVLAELNNGIIDNIDGLKYDGTIYYRKNYIPRPHNAFTDFDLLAQAVRQLGYQTTDVKPVAYQHERDSKGRGSVQPDPIFNEKFVVVWRYDERLNSYFRTRSGSPEIDKNDGKQVYVKNVVIMKTSWKPVNKDYIRVKTVGNGDIKVYRDGEMIAGTWQKKDDKAKLYFFDQNGKEIEFAPGSIWVEINP